MGSMTDIKSVLSQKNLDIFCKNFHIPDEVHPLLPSRNQTIHEMPTGKIGVYTRFFEFANFRLPLSTFLVDVLRYYRIHISQLSVIAAAKVSHFEILCRVHDCEPTVGLFRCFYVNSKNKGWMSFSKRPGHDAVCYTKPLDSLKGWNDHFFWVDAFACPASFSWHTGKSVSKDPFPQSTEFNAEHYASLVAYPAPFHKYPEPFLCLVGISRYYTLDENTYPDTADPMKGTGLVKVRIGERQRGEDEPKLLDTTVGRVVPLLPVAPARASSELEASVDKLFEEGGSGSHAEHGDSVSGGHDVGIPQVSEIAKVFAEDAAPLQPRRPSVVGKSRSTLQRLLTGAVLNPEVGVVALPTLPFITSSVSVTPEREDGDQTDFIAGANLRTITAPPRFFISSDSSHHSGANIVEGGVDSFARPSAPLMTMTTTITSTVDPTTTAKEKFVESSILVVVLLLGLSIPPDTDLQKVYIPQWSVTNGSYLDDGRTYHEMVDEFAPPKFFALIRGMEHDKLFTEFNVGAPRQMSLSASLCTNYKVFQYLARFRMSGDISLADLCKDEIRYTYFMDSDLKMQFRVTNYTSLKPLGDRVLTKIKAAEEKSIGGRTIGDKKIDIGVKTGTQVVYSKYSRTEVEFNGSNHLILKEVDILGILETEELRI
ncbi:gypsy type transposase [Tanacetum coccineum]